MRIESLKTTPDRAGRYWVTFSDGTKLGLYRQTVEDFGLYTGMEMTQEQFCALQTAAGQMSAKMRAVRIVSASGVSKRDLEQRLVQKGEDPVQAKEAVRWMAEMDLVDDRRTAEDVVRRCISKGYGLTRAKQALYEKKIPREFWEEALADYPDQLDKILEFLRSRLGDEPTDKDVRKAVDALMRRGHKWQHIRQALTMLGEDTEEFPED